MAIDLELIEERSSTTGQGVVPNACRINGVSVSLVPREPIDIAVGEDELTRVTLTMFVNTLTIKSEE